MGWKWIHTSSCPEIQEYGGFNKLRRYCVECLRCVHNVSSSDWRYYYHVRRRLKLERRKMRSLQQLCMKQIIERNIKFTKLPTNVRNQIQEIKKSI